MNPERSHLFSTKQINSSKTQLNKKGNSMKKSLMILGLAWSLFINSNESTTLDQITVEELTSIVRAIIQES